MSAWAPPPPPAPDAPAPPTGGAAARLRAGGSGPVVRARHLLAAVIGAAGVCAVVAVASRVGGLPGDHDPGDPARRELLPRVVLGVLGASTIALVLTFLFHLRFGPRFRSGRRKRFGVTAGAALPLFAVVAGFGALAGASTTPLRERGAITRDAGFTLTARPVDADGDGRIDADATGRATLGLDLDDDGRVDRVLPACRGAELPTVDDVERAALPNAARIQITVDTDCDGAPERIVYLDPQPAPVAPDAVQPNSPGADSAPVEILERSVDRVQGLVAAAAVAALALLAGLVVGGVVLLLRGVRFRGGPEVYALADDVHGDSAPIDRAIAAEAFGESIDAMLTDPDPRTGIIGAYAKLLDGLDRAGLTRRPEEAPLEHLHRCLAALEVPPGPLERLTELFVLARFSTHRMHEGHRLDALDALRAALGHLAERPDALATAGGRRP